MQLSLLLTTILRAAEGVVVTFGLVCSSFVSISRGSTYRSYFRPEGDLTSKSVQRGNLLAARIGFGLSNLKSQSNMIMIMNSDQHLLLYIWFPFQNDTTHIVLKHEIHGTYINMLHSFLYVQKSVEPTTPHSLPQIEFVAPNPLHGQSFLCVCGRTVLAMLVVMAKRGVWVLEQPASSIVMRLKRFQQLLRKTTAACLKSIYANCLIVVNVL